MISEELLRTAGWSEDVIEAVKRANIESESLMLPTIAASDATIDIIDELFTESSRIDLRSASDQEFAWPRFA